MNLPSRLTQENQTTIKALLSESRMQRDALWSKLPPFDLQKALLGQPYVHLFDLPSHKVCYNDIRQVAAPNAGYMLWAGEWLFMSYEELASMCRMADPAVLGGLEMKTTRPVLGAFGEAPPASAPAEAKPASTDSFAPGWQAFKDMLRWSAIAVAFVAAGFLAAMALLGGAR